MSESRLILNTNPPSSTAKPTERDVVMGVVAELLPALHTWRAQWQARHPKQAVTSVYVADDETEERAGH
jgi:hypothetical protein